MIAQATNIKQRILDIKHGRVKEGLKIGIPEFDEYIRLKLDGSINLICGHANVGKTTIICYLITLWAEMHKVRVLVFSSENSAEHIVRKIIEFKMGKPIQTANENEISKALNWCDSYFKIIDVEDLYTYKTLLKEADQIKDVWDYELFIIDPYNSLIKDKDELRSSGGAHEYDYAVLTKLRLWSKKRNVTTWINVHGVTEALRKLHPKGHEYENLPMPLGLASIEGGGKFGNRVNDVICCHRYVSSPTEWMYTHLHVLKCKLIETGGRVTPYEQPLKLRMSKNNAGFEFLGKDIMHSKKSEVEEILF